MGKVIPLAAAVRVQPPHPLTSEHTLSGFDCGDPVLNDWLRRWALANQVSRVSRTFVVTPDGETDVAAYYTLAAGSVSHADAIRDVRHATPDPIPVTILGRLAVTKDWQGTGLGKGLLRDAILRTIQVSEFIGTAALLVHAINEDAAQFYERFGFKRSRVTPCTLMLPMRTILASHPTAPSKPT